ncbi:hypothetical protein [Nocardiopsis synnemataformans]|uniref:hypothetical protein n=1 Tax=Nocardiopsis synnemataformans TaxID=61305 RepID=UPI003EB950EC
MADWLAGQRITAERLRAGQGVWQPYTPSWTAATTNPSIGNGQIIGRWMQVGTTVDFMLRIVAGSTTSFGNGPYDFGLPVPPRSWGAGSNLGAVGQCVIQIDNHRYGFGVLLFSTGLVRVADSSTSGLGNNSAQNVGHDGHPWGDGDLLLLSGRYEVT